MRTLTLTLVLALFLLLGVGILSRHRTNSARVPPPASVATVSLRVSLAVDPGNGTLFKAESTHLLRSTDGGRRWMPVRIPASLAPTGVNQIAVSREKPAFIYTAGVDAGVLLSPDGGATWQQINTGLPSTEVEALAIHSFRRETLFVSVRGRGTYRTENGGRQWQRMDGGPPVQPVLALAHSPLEGSMNTGWLYAGTRDGPYISMDCF